MGFLIPRGADHHGFEPSLADRGRLDAASLVVANGGGLEGGLEDTLAATPTPIHSIVGNAADPHIWLDPISVAEALPALASALIDHAGLNPADIEACRLDLDTRLRSLDEDIQGLLSTIPASQRSFVTGHAMLGDSPIATAWGCSALSWSRIPRWLNRAPTTSKSWPMR